MDGGHQHRGHRWVSAAERSPEAWPGQIWPSRPLRDPTPRSLGTQAAGKTSAVGKLLVAEEGEKLHSTSKGKASPRAWNSGKSVLPSLNSNHCFSREI